MRFGVVAPTEENNDHSYGYHIHQRPLRERGAEPVSVIGAIWKELATSLQHGQYDAKDTYESDKKNIALTP